ncbi:MAG: NAD-dependent epimerase/dehydratase family protein [Cryomorphaceae bacterium]|nr:MAG: NAD-dependent epimerase/dehydratase family protein [Cryomorphaceae bacterium]
MQSEKILILGAAGQIGSDLTEALRARYGAEAVVASDLHQGIPQALEGGPYVQLNAMDRQAIEDIVQRFEITQVYHLVAMLSATAEQHPLKGWELNMQTLFHCLEMAREQKIKRLYWPSSIAVFGPRSPRQNTPQHTILEPSTVYGISKVAGESWCEYYHQKYGVDVRSVRYPGLISYRGAPGGGTTDYAVHIFHEAIKHGHYTSFIQADRSLPMMYMPDAIRATLEIMHAPADKVRLRSAYNIAGMSFNPEEIAASIRRKLPDFSIDYAPDYRNEIAANWPASVDDSAAHNDWGWQPEYDLDRMVDDMLEQLRQTYVA